MGLEGKTCLVTGSSRGIGHSIAESLCQAGANVVVNARNTNDVQTVVNRLNQKNSGRVFGVVADVSRPDECDDLISRSVDEFGQLDVLINNAGIGIFESIEQLSLKNWKAQIDTNLLGVFVCSRLAIPHLLKTEGWIINIGSLACRNSFAGGTGYNASKFGLLGMTEAMMLDLRSKGIRVSIVMPGSVDTSFLDGDSKKWALTSDDVASATLHLLSYPRNAHPSRIEIRPSQPPSS
ncbi:MAG TPA: SDR family oxidoreductase [Gemmatimonadetes bacterium]|jgi:NAD(P)-dependent dehydrogenase (short-subunit alcohol dehydrogenase family)|nr:SDR family oxidoreductase [Gemmatimonadota bacterium]